MRLAKLEAIYVNPTQVSLVRKEGEAATVIEFTGCDSDGAVLRAMVRMPIKDVVTEIEAAMMYGRG